MRRQYDPNNTLNRFYTAAEIDQAKKADLIDVLQKLGFRLRSCGGKEYCLEDHDSFKISNNLWCWNSRGKIGGDAIDLLIKHPDFNYSFTKAVGTILELTGGANNLVAESPAEYQTKKKNEKRQLILPEANHSNNRVIAYLTKTRGIDYHLIIRMIKEKKLYEDKDFHNAVFVGYDGEGAPRYGFKRGTVSDSSRYAGDVEGSDKSYGFLIRGTSNIVRVFEAPIDDLSYLTIQMINNTDCKDHLLSLGCVDHGALERFLSEEKGIKKIIVCTDNDKAGRECGERILKIYGDNYDVDFDYPKMKDYNLDLTELRKNFDQELRMDQ